MNWWGKLIGGTFGYLLGGPIGAVLGAALGHQFDRGMRGIMLDPEFGSGQVERVQTAFFTTTFSIMGHLAKADGRVSETEIAMARHIMDQMQLDEEQRATAIKLFQQGKESDFPLDDVLEQFRRECHRRRNLIQMFLEIQISTAMADGVLDDKERQLLLHISEGLGIPRGMFEQLLNMVGAQQAYTQSGKSPTEHLADAYGVLGVDKRASDAEVKKAYKRLMSQHHPDKLVSKGLPEEMMKIATEKTQEIKAAYELIKENRQSA